MRGGSNNVDELMTRIGSAIVAISEYPRFIAVILLFTGDNIQIGSRVPVTAKAMTTVLYGCMRNVHLYERNQLY